MRAMAAPVLSHLDPDMLRADGRPARAARAHVRRRPTATPGDLGHGLGGMETGRRQPGARRYARPRRRHRLLRRAARPICARAMARWSAASTCRGAAPSIRRSCAARLKQTPADIVAMVHAETSTGVLNPVEAVAQVAREHGCLMLVDAVTSLGAHPVDVAGWQIDAGYSCTQKGLGAPSGMAPIAFSARAPGSGAKCRSFYFDLGLLEEYWSGASITTRSRRRSSTRSAKRSSRSRKKALEARFARHRRTTWCSPPASARWASSCCRPKASGCGR